jgi:hypothetical protein
MGVEVFLDRIPVEAITADEIYETLILDVNYPFQKLNLKTKATSWIFTD